MKYISALLLIIVFEASCSRSEPPTCNISGAYQCSFTNSYYGIDSGTFVFGAHDSLIEYYSIYQALFFNGTFLDKCDSILIAWNRLNADTVFLKGKFLNNYNNISGTYKNNTIIADSGSFYMTKQ